MTTATGISLSAKFYLQINDAWISQSVQSIMRTSKSEGFDSCDGPSNLTQIGFKSSIFHQALCIFSNPWVNWNWSYCSETLNSGQNWRFFVPCDLEIWWMTLKNDKTPLLCYIKLYASIQSHQLIQTGVTVQKSSIWVKNRQFFIPCDLEIRRMTLKNNRAPLLCCFKLCASFYNHRWILAEVTVRKHSMRVKIGDLLPRVTLKFNGWPWKTIGYLFYVASSFMHHFIAISEFKLKMQSGNTQFGSKSVIFCPVWPWYLTNDLEKQ